MEIGVLFGAFGAPLAWVVKRVVIPRFNARPLRGLETHQEFVKRVERENKELDALGHGDDFFTREG